MDDKSITRLKFLSDKDLTILQCETAIFILNAQKPNASETIEGFVFKGVSFYYDPIEEKHHACIAYDATGINE